MREYTHIKSYAVDSVMATIRISRKTREEMKRVGKKSQTYDEIIKELLTHISECDRFWVNR